MKKLSVILISIFFLSALTLNAQMYQGDNQQQGMMSGSGMMQGGMMQGGMMQGGMMQGNMMGSGMMGMGQNMMGQYMIMNQHVMMIHSLPYLQSQLSLSQNQQEELIDIWSSFRKQQVGYQTDLAKENIKLQDILNNEVSVDKVKNQLEAYYESKVQMNTAAYKILKEMKSVLSEEQRQDLQNMLMNKRGMMQGNMQQRRSQQGGMMNMNNRRNNQ